MLNLSSKVRLGKVYLNSNYKDCSNDKVQNDDCKKFRTRTLKSKSVKEHRTDIKQGFYVNFACFTKKVNLFM